MVADVLLKYTRLPFDDEEYKSEQENKALEEAKRNTLSIDQIEFTPEMYKDKPVYVLMTFAENVLRVTPGKHHEAKVSNEVSRITFTEKMSPEQTLGIA